MLTMARRGDDMKIENGTTFKVKRNGHRIRRTFENIQFADGGVSFDIIDEPDENDASAGDAAAAALLQPPPLSRPGPPRRLVDGLDVAMGDPDARWMP
jgi:hypothetical protein